MHALSRVLLVFISGLLIAAASPSRKLDQQVQSAAKEKWSPQILSDEARALHTEDVIELIHESGQKVKTFDGVVAEVAERLSLSESVVRPLVRGVLPLMAPDFSKETSLEPSLTDLKAAVRLSGQHPATVAALIGFLRWKAVSREMPDLRTEKELKDLLASLPSKPLAKGRLLLAAADAADSVDAVQRALQENPGLLCFIGPNVSDDSPSAALLLEKALQDGLARRDVCDLATLGRLTRRTLSRQLALGLMDAATSLYSRLPADVKDAAYQRPLSSNDDEDSRELSDVVIMALASSFALEKQPAPARELRDQVAKDLQGVIGDARATEDADFRWTLDTVSGLPQLISFDIGDAAGDPFDALLPLLVNGHGEQPLPTAFLAARVAAKRYPIFAFEKLESIEHSLFQYIDPVQSCLEFRKRWGDGQLSDKDQAECQKERGDASYAALYAQQGIDPTSAVEVLRALHAQVAGERQALEKALKAPDDKADPVASSLQRLLEAPRLSVWKEMPLPKTKSKPALRAKITLPSRDFRVLRAEQYGQRVVAVASSTLYDPSGELSSGGYWLLQSKDGGATWAEPVYLGLTEYLPYEVVEDSKLPLLNGDDLQLEVNVKELDSKRIMFPPIAMRPKRVATGRMISCPLRTLAKDTDGDGLTDLAEERLVLDPADPDTDGDGNPDGADPLPQVRSSGTPNIRAELMTRIAFNDSMGKPIVIGVNGGIGTPTNRPDPETRFVVGDRRDFGPPATSRRLIVLTEAEYQLARKKFGPFLPGEVSLFLVNEAGTKAYVRWTEHWRGGSFLAELLKGQWIVHVVGSWIS